MKIKAQFLLKDKILETILKADYQNCSISDLSKKMNIAYYKIHSLVDDLIYEGFVECTHDITSKEAGHHHNKIVRVTAKGHFFLKEKGGFKDQYSNERAKHIWIRLKIIANVANALMIILVSIWAVQVSDKSTSLEKRLEEKENIIIELNDELKLLQTKLLPQDTVKVK